MVRGMIVCRTYGSPSRWCVTGLAVVGEADVPHFYDFLQKATAAVPIEMMDGL